MAPRRPPATKRKRDNGASGAEARGKRLRVSEPPELTQRPTQTLNIYVFGANSGGELGLGPEVKSGTIGRPRLNPYLSGSVGVVQVSLGAMHGVALTADNKVLTWGVNDHGALGRDTAWEAKMVDADASDSDVDSDDGGDLNPRESTPTPVDLPPNLNFTQVAATDNATFVLTSTGLVYGWGTFRSEDGKLAFSPGVRVQTRPALIPFISNTVKICCGSNHVMALTADGSVYTWGRGNDGQLGHRLSRHVVDWMAHGLTPRKVGGLANVADIGSGSNHSFAVGRDGRVYGWGFNNAGQLGVDWGCEAIYVTPTPTYIPGLRPFGRITQITGGNFHTLAATEDGRCLAWGRLYSFATGLPVDQLPGSAVVRDSRGKPSFTGVPTVVAGVAGRPAALAAASEHSLAVTTAHEVYTWGLNLTKQLAQRDEEVRTPTPLRHASIEGRRIVWAGAGAQFSMLAELAGSDSTVALN